MTVQELLDAAGKLSLSDQVRLASELMQAAINRIQLPPTESLPETSEATLPDQNVANGSKQSSYEIFQDLGLVGCIKDADPQLSRNYKSLVHEEIENRHNRDRQ